MFGAAVLVCFFVFYASCYCLPLSSCSVLQFHHCDVLFSLFMPRPLCCRASQWFGSSLPSCDCLRDIVLLRFRSFPREDFASRKLWYFSFLPQLRNPRVIIDSNCVLQHFAGRCATITIGCTSGGCDRCKSNLCQEVGPPLTLSFVHSTNTSSPTQTMK